MDKDSAFIEINYINNSIENEDKSNYWKAEEIRKVLAKLQTETFDRGKQAGVYHSIKSLQKLKEDMS